MYADWLHDLQVVGGGSMMADVFQGAESYLQMCERAGGVPAMSCRPARERFTNVGLGQAIRLGAGTEAALYRMMPGVWVGRRLRAGARYVYGVRAGRVRFVAVTTAPELRSAALLRSGLRAAGL
jgi:hypothetical protein